MSQIICLACMIMYRLGALRFKQELDGDFLDNNEQLAAPPIASLRELEHADFQVEEAAEQQ